MKKFISVVLIAIFILSFIQVSAEETDVLNEVRQIRTVINSQDYTESTGNVIDTDECWLNESPVNRYLKGKFILLNKNETWSAAYKINVPKGKAGLYNMSVKCFHWGNVELSLYLDEVKVGKVLPTRSVEGDSLPELSVGNINLSEGEHTILVKGDSPYSGYCFEEIVLTAYTEGIVIKDGKTTLSAGEYYSKTDTLELTDYWIDPDNYYLLNPDNETWSVTYKIYVPEGKEGLYKILAVCNHWGNVEIRVTIDESGLDEHISASRVEKLPVPKLEVGYAVLDAGKHLVTVEGLYPVHGYYFRELTLEKIPTMLGSENLKVVAHKPDFSVEGEASIKIVSYNEKIRNAFIMAVLKNGSMVENVYRGEEMPLETGVETTLKVSGIKTELTSGESYTFYVFDSLNKLSPLAMTFGDGAYLEPSLAEFRADDSELNDAYDFITAEDGGFKGVYCFFEQYKETETIEALLDSGVNSFIVFLLNKENYTEDGMKSIIEKWKAVIGDAKLYTVVAYGSDSEFNNRAFGTFIDKYGDDISAPCPLSKEYWNKVYGERSTLAEKLGADGCLADMEMYAAKRTHFYSECYCDKCWNSFVKYAFYDETLEYSNAQTPEAEEGEKRNFCERAAYISENGLSDEYRNYQENSLIGILSDIRNSLPEDFMLGYLIYYEDVAGITKGLGSPNAPCLVLDEYTYFADGSEGYDYSNRTWGHLRTTYDVGNPAILLPGFWSNKYSPENQKSVIDKITKINYDGKNADGIWFWCMTSFMHSSDEEGYDGYGCMPGQTPSEYIKTLKEVKPKYNY